MNEVLKKLHNKMLTGVNGNAFPGATYAIIYKNRVVTDVVGNKALYPNVELNSIDTIYDVASLTKVVVTNVLICKLIEEGKIQLFDKVKKYIPEFKHDDITIFDLLTHSSGIPANVSWWHIKTKEEYLQLIFNVDKEYERHSKAVYSDIGFIILGILIERVTGKSLDKLAKEEIFEKLEMHETMYNPVDHERCAPTEKNGDTYLKGIVHDPKARLFNGVAGHAGVFSTVFDLVKFAQTVLNDGKYKDYQLLSKKTIDMWYKPTFKDFEDRYRTIGWLHGKTSKVCDNISDMAIYHQGFTGSRLLIDKKNDLAIILLSNRIHPTRENDVFKDFWCEFVTLVYEELVKQTVK